MATIVGGLVALAAHSSKTGLRMVVTPSPEPISNIALSAGEDVVAVGLTWFAAHHPLLAASLAGVLLIGAGLAARALYRGLRRLKLRMSQRLSGKPAEPVHLPLR